MRIGTIEIYEKYIENINNSISSLDEEIKNYSISKEYLLGKIKIFEHYIRNFSNIKYDDIKDLDRFLPEKSVTFNESNIGLDLEILRVTINNITDINKSINRCKKQIETLQSNYIDKEKFKEVIHQFNTKISDEIVFKGYCFELGFRLGWIKIKKLDVSLRKKKKIDWGKSNKRKAEIIAEGKLPFKAFYDEHLNLVGDNGGEKWHIYHENKYDCLWHWAKKHANAENVPYYKFRPTRYNNSSNGGGLGNVNKLKALVTGNSELLKNYL